MTASKPPAELGKDGRALWRRVTSDVPADWELDSRDLTSLAVACHATDRAMQLEKCVSADGPMVVGSTGQPVVHPAIAEIRQQRALAAQLVGKVEVEPPAAKTGGMNRRQRSQLADARGKRWPRGAAG